MKNRSVILAIIVCAQFACVSLWFVPNALMQHVAIERQSIEGLTFLVQLGFIIGTLAFAFFSIPDKISPSKVFFGSALIGAICNACLLLIDDIGTGFYALRFLTGFFLAGIYPVGMKIASDYFEKDIGKALGYLLGALVLGTAFPHFIAFDLLHIPYTAGMLVTSFIAIAGGLIVFLFVPDGPFRKPGQAFNPGALWYIFKNRSFRKTALGYFGHMWELYAFWTFFPLVIEAEWFTIGKGNSLLAFIIIAVGAPACVIGGYIARTAGNYKVAMTALVSSFICCIFSPFILTYAPGWILPFFLFWGMVVIMDSPQFSSLIARYAPAENRGSALTIVNCIGFSVTIVSILLLDFLRHEVGSKWLLLFLAPGPFLGVLFFENATKKSESDKNQYLEERP